LKFHAFSRIMKTPPRSAATIGLMLELGDI
jgi:hypothetical protein